MIPISSNIHILSLGSILIWINYILLIPISSSDSSMVAPRHSAKSQVRYLPVDERSKGQQPHVTGHDGPRRFLNARLEMDSDGCAGTGIWHHCIGTEKNIGKLQSYGNSGLLSWKISIWNRTFICKQALPHLFWNSGKNNNSASCHNLSCFESNLSICNNFVIFCS